MAEQRRHVVPNLRAWRLHRLMAQEQLAKAAGVGVNTIFRLERPEERANELTIYKLARGLGVSVRELLEEEPPEKDAAA